MLIRTSVTSFRKLRKFPSVLYLQRVTSQRQAYEKYFLIDNPSLTESEKSSIYEVLSRHPKVISGGKTDLGEAKGIEHSIDTGNAKPIKVPTK